MARNRLVDRAKAAATRSVAESPTESRQRRYRDDLAHEIGPTNFGRPMHDGDDRQSLVSVMTQPAMIMILAIITFSLTFIVLLWREGRLDHLFATQAPSMVQKDPKAWMLGRNADGVIEDTNPNAGEPDVMANAASTPAALTKTPETAAEPDTAPDSAPETSE